MRPTVPTLTALVVMTAVTLAGCTGGATTATPTSTSSSATTSAAAPQTWPTQPTSSPAAATSGDAVPTTAAMAVGASDLDSPLASRTISYSGAKVSLDVWAPQIRDHQMYVTVRATLDPAANGPAQLMRLLADADPASQVRGIPDGIRVVDPVARKEYLPSLGPDKLPLCSPNMVRSFAPGDITYVTCTYGKPTGDPKRLQIVAPNFGSFDAPAR